MPGIEMGAKHDELIRFIGAWNLGHNVERVQIVIIKLVFNIDFESNRNFLLQYSPDPSVVLDRHDHLSRHRRVRYASPASTLNKNRPAAARAWFNCCNDALVHEESLTPFVECWTVASTSACAPFSGASAARWLDGLGRQRLQFVLGKSTTRSLKLRLHFRHGRNHHVLPA